MRRFIILWALLIALLAACTTSPTGRHQLLLVSDADINQMGQQTFNQMRQKGEFAQAPKQKAFASCVVKRLVGVLPPPWNNEPWQVEIIKDNTPNAFALPGGRIGVNLGMFKLADNQELLAVVLGHEMGHVVARHSAERVSSSMLSELGVSIASSGRHGINASVAQQIFGIGYLLPFSRKQESEADTIGQRYMAQAGFNPRQAVTLWQKMQQINGGSDASFLSTHPSPSQRIQNLKNGAEKLYPVYQAAIAQSKPSCSL